MDKDLFWNHSFRPEKLERNG